MRYLLHDPGGTSIMCNIDNLIILNHSFSNAVKHVFAKNA